MARFRTLEDLDLPGKRVLLRVDLNVPMKDGEVTDTTRIDRILPTVETLMGAGARVILLSHFGRPKGEKKPEMSLRPVVSAVEAALGDRKVAFAEDCIGSVARFVINGMADGSVALLENLRFHPGEEENDQGFARELADLGDIYVNDAFSASHRAHASVDAITRLMPSAAGRLMQTELEHLERALENPKRPLIAIVGGAKVSTKIPLLTNLIEKVDRLAIGGGMANTFLHAQGLEVGRSLCESDMKETAGEILSKATETGCEILLPIDAVVAEKLEAGVKSVTVPVSEVPEDSMILDCGPGTSDLITEKMHASSTLVWNGPLGCFETPPFDASTVAVAREAAKLTENKALLSVAGGGDTIAALSHAGAIEAFSYVSTAGGAFLEWLEGKTLPGVAALEEAA